MVVQFWMIFFDITKIPLIFFHFLFFSKSIFYITNMQRYIYVNNFLNPIVKFTYKEEKRIISLGFQYFFVSLISFMPRDGNITHGDEALRGSAPFGAEMRIKFYSRRLAGWGRKNTPRPASSPSPIYIYIFIYLYIYNIIKYYF